MFLPGEFLGLEEPGGLQSMGSQRDRHDRANNTTPNLQLVEPTNVELWVWKANHEDVHRFLFGRLAPPTPVLFKGRLNRVWYYLQFQAFTRSLGMYPRR